mmetsp:Transcript_15859/g.21480  ORF Transcript_15859/g.21480 Transcript_15859/m.21480 type:complete len:265 (-) Transcript_15859:7-801(-)
MVIVRGRLICHPVAHHCVHLPDCEEDAPSEFVLVVDGEPAVEAVASFGLQDLRDGQFVELLLLEDVEVVHSLGLVAELMRVLRRRLHLAHDLSRVVRVHNIHTEVVGREGVRQRLVVAAFEAFHSLQVDHAFYHVQTLFVLLAHGEGPLEELGLVELLDDLTNDVKVALVSRVARIALHLVVKGALGVPPRPHGGLGRQRRGHQEVLVAPELFQDFVAAFEPAVFHYLHDFNRADCFKSSRCASDELTLLGGDASVLACCFSRV